MASTQELLNAQVHLWNHIFNYINSMALKCALQLGIPDAIHKHGKPITLSQLAVALSINEAKIPGLFRLMRILVHSGLFKRIHVSEQDEEEDEGEAYSLTPSSRLLLGDEEPLSMRPFALAMLDPVMMDPFQCMSEWFINDLPSTFFTKYGISPWEYVDMDKNCSGMYNEAMASDARLVADVIVKECKHLLEGVKTMVDVGGGAGMVVKGIADAMPGLKCVVFDLPRVVDGL